MSANKIIVEGRPFLYNFDFLKFRGRAEENIRLSIPFACQGVCWKFKFAGYIRVWVTVTRYYVARQTKKRMPIR